MLESSGRLAAKFSANVDPAGPSWHPLVCHMVDVAAVAQGLWDASLAEWTRERLATAMGLDQESARLWIGWLAGIHDLGKASKPFQFKDPLHRERLRGTGLDATTDRPDPGHGRVTAAALITILQKDPFRLSPPLASRLAAVTGGHHGEFPTGQEVLGSRGPAIGEVPPGPNRWQEVRADLATTLASLVGIESAHPSDLPTPAAMLLAGLISVADWIGSIDEIAFFPYRPDAVTNLGEYATLASDRARVVLDKLHWTTSRVDGSVPGFGELFPVGLPYPVQERVAEQARSVVGPSLMIIEAPMGEGKTEAALYFVESDVRRGSRGAYFGLPTQATANQLYQRVHDFFVRSRSGETTNLVLAHGGASFASDLQYLPTDVSGPDGAVGAGSWFVQRKRTLLASYGVGTVDQALMAALRTKHVFVRLFGLAGKTVVIDEVHAYDAYMSHLLDRLLEWLAALGSSVVLLSATLPSSRRRAFLQAYARGLGSETSPPTDSNSPGYPRLSHLSERGAHSEAVPAAARSFRRLIVARLAPEPDDVASYLIDRMPTGGCAVVICNTVARAQEMFRVVQAALSEMPQESRPEVDLLHARFRLGDRRQREARVVGQLGPGSQDRPHRSVLVATQIVEQSLDIDFDVMVSDIAPIDLLLQRSGRLHRHDRGSRGEPTLYVRWPADAGGLPTFDGGTASVYDEHILLRTWCVLTPRSDIAIPDDVEGLIEFVYGEDEGSPPEALRPAVAARWGETWRRMHARRRHAEQEAANRMLPGPDGPSFLDEYTRWLREEDSPDLHPAHQALTRLAEPTVDVVLLDVSHPLASRTKPSLSPGECLELVRSSVPISSPSAVSQLAALPIPDAFSRSPLLRRHRLVPLVGGEAVVGDLTITYDPDLGVLLGRTREAPA